MIRSRENGFFIVQVEKTGSVALAVALRDINDLGEYERHMPARQLQQEFAQDWNDLRTYSVIRHPKDWLRSWFKYLRGHELQGTPKGRQLGDMSFGEFVRRNAEPIRPPWRPWRAGTIDTPIVGAQASRLCDPQGNLLVDELWALENVDVEFSRFCAVHGVPGERSIERRNVSPPVGMEDDSWLDDFIAIYWELDLQLWQAAKDALAGRSASVA